MENTVLVNVALLMIRLAVGLTFVGHGTQKLFGWFGGHGVAGTGQWLESIGIKPGGKIWAVAAGLFELVGGLLVAVGFLTIVGAALIVAVMIDAIITVHARNGYWIDRGGFEYNFILIVVMIALAFLGPGQYVFLYHP